MNRIFVKQIGLIVMLWSITGGTAVHGQVGGILTNEELNLQKLFIDANREKLLGAHEEAASLYEEVLNQDPENDAAAYELSRVYESMGKYQEALDYINKAVKLDPGNTWYLMMKGDILERMEEYAGAIEVYKHLTEINPRENYYFRHLIDLYLDTNQPERALATLESFERNAGILPDIIRSKVNILDELGKPADAVTELEKLVTVYPDNLDYLHLISSFCVKAGFRDKADTYYRQILEIDPNDARANIAMADQLKEEGEDAAYLRSITGLMENTSIELDVKIQELIPFVQKFADTRDPVLGDALGGVIGVLLEQHGDEAKTHAIHADYLYYSGKPYEAVREYEHTLVLNKGVFTVWEQLMYIQTELGDFNGVIRTAEQAMDVFPNQASIYYLSGMAHARIKDFHEAASQLQQALIMSGRNKELRFNVLSLLGSVYNDLGDRVKSYDAFDKALEINPDVAGTLTSYAFILALNKESLQRAMEMATRALKLAPGNPAIEHTIAWTAYQQNDLVKARKFIEQAMDHGGGDNYLTLEHYGDILYSAGDIDEAVAHWQLSVEAGNPSDVVKRKIAERKIVH